MLHISENSRRRSPSSESPPISDTQDIPVVRGKGNGRRGRGDRYVRRPRGRTVSRSRDGDRERGDRGRGRGDRGRGRGDRSRERGDHSRGRGDRGRGRGGRRPRHVVYGPALPTRADLAATAREERDTQLRECISTLTEETKDDLIRRMCEKHPQFVFDVLIGSTQEQGGYHPDHRPDNEPSLTWCRCTHCREMPTEAETVCCNQAPHNCYSRLQDFDLVVLDEVVLVAQRYRQDVLAAGHDDDFNRGKRHAAYMQFILWNHGYLGAGNRRVIIPSCCVWKIRDKYPDRFGQYRGFVGGRLG